MPRLPVGLAGLVVAVPILALILVLVRHILLGEVYGDQVSETKPGGLEGGLAPEVSVSAAGRGEASEAAPEGFQDR